MKQLILIDGNSLLFRAYFAMRPMVTSNGIHTQGIFAFINMLNKIINDYKPDYIAVAFDMKEKTFRHEVYKDYKAGRLQTPIELLSEIPLLHKVLEAMNIAVFELPKYEADDIIGTISRDASNEGINTIIISGDKDELQLVDENVRVLINKKGMSEFDIYDIPAMRDRYNLTPTQFIDLKSLMGDKSDNIPGVPGVGEKKGIALLEEYESLERIIDNAENIKGKLGESIRDNIESAKLSKWLATINRNVPIDFSWEKISYREPDINKLVDIYTELEFSSFIKKLNITADGPSTSAENTTDAFTFDASDYSKLSEEKFLERVEAGSDVCLITLTDNNHLGIAYISKVLLLSTVAHCYTCFYAQGEDLENFILRLSEKKYRLLGYDLKRSLYSFISNVESDWLPYYDVMIAEYLLDANRSKYSLSKMALRYLSLVVDDEQLSLMEDKGPIAMEAIDDNTLLYRAFVISRIKEVQEKELNNKGLDKLFFDCEMPLCLTLAELEKEGIRLDPEILMSIGSEISDKLLFLEEKIYRAAGVQFNINSPKQLGTILFDKLNIPYPKSGNTGSYSTAADVLDKLKYDYDIVSDVLEFRKLSKLKSTYVDGIMCLIGHDMKIHPHFQQTVAATGRLSCTEPNLQNIPIRDDYGRLIRKAFVVEKSSNVFTAADYSQIELRILAALSGDELLIAAFNEGKDIHRATASNVFNIPFDEVSSTDRSKAKAVNFGVVYGMSGFGLSENLDISRSNAQKYINDYFEKHTSVKAYLDKLVEEGEKNQYVSTYYGRIRQIPEFTSRKYMEREAAKRLAMNTPIQGTAADIIKLAMNSVRYELKNRGLKSKLVLQIHDELIIEGPEIEQNEVAELLKDCMVNASDLVVKLTVDLNSAKDWYGLK